MQAALQTLVDGAISNTVNVPQDQDFADCNSLHERAYVVGLKGIMVFRTIPVNGAVMAMPGPKVGLPHCCSVAHEAD